MSTLKNNITNRRFATLARLGEVVFHISDLANIWKITNENTLRTTLKRYVQDELLYRIYRGFYSIKPIKEVDPWLLGVRAINDYAYVSTETILAEAGIIQQIGHQITIISGQSKNFKIGKNNYRSRKLSDKFLYQNTGIYTRNGVRIAKTERAIADMLYFNSKMYFDRMKYINWKNVKKMQIAIGYPLTPKYYDIA